MALEIDLETRSELNLTDVGADVYFEHPSTEIIEVCYAFGDDPVQTWYPGAPCPRDIADFFVNQDSPVRGWNVGFERRAWTALLGPKHGWAVPPLARFEDNAAAGAAMGLPRSLEDAAIALGLEEQKDSEGHRLMLAMARGLYRDVFEALQRLTAYCAQDVVTSRAVRKKLFPLQDRERALWILDQQINDRGVRVDRELVAAMDEIVKHEMLRLNGDLSVATGGAVEKLSQTVRLAAWLRSQGVDCTSLAKDQFERLLGLDMPEHARRALLVRREGSKSSTGKLEKARVATSADGRASGMLLFNGASTGRWSGKLFQPHNLVRGSGTTDPSVSIPLIRQGMETVSFCYEYPLTAVADAMRGVLIAAEGKTFYSGDYSSIEARITAWLAGDLDKLDQFRAADRHEGPGMYELAAAGIYGVPVDSIAHEDPRRQTGKTAELALGFGGGVAALDKMARNYGIDMADAYTSLMDRTDKDKQKKVQEKYEQTRRSKNTEMTERAWIACELTKQYWRKANPLTVKSWQLVEDCAWSAMSMPGAKMTCNGVPIGWVYEGGFLQMILPSGRKLYYADPRIREVEVPWSDKRLPVRERERKQAVTVKGIDQVTTRFTRYPLYPGLGIQHATQATARDLLANGMMNADRDFPIVLTVHDELLAEVEPGAPPLSEFLETICKLPPWASGLPLVADGWAGPRYHKK